MTPYLKTYKKQKSIQEALAEVGLWGMDWYPSFPAHRPAFHNSSQFEVWKKHEWKFSKVNNLYILNYYSKE